MTAPRERSLPRCDRTDLPRSMCAHCLRVPDTVPDLGPPVAAPVPAVGGRLRVDYRSRKWEFTDPGPIICDDGHDDDRALCPKCEERVRAALLDVPNLVADLVIHLSRQNVFLERGVPQQPDEDGEVVEESPLPYAERASKALSELALLLGDQPRVTAARLLRGWYDTRRRPDLEEFASRLGRAVARGMRAIDVDPYLTNYGKCPECGHEIRTERVPDGQSIACQQTDCGYSARVENHRQAQLDLGADTQMPLTKVVQVLNDAGERTTRQEIENLIYRDGLPREELPVWRNGKLEKVWHFRLGDVRDWRARKKNRGLDKS